MIDLGEEEAPAGLPAWLATFADLMSLLMCFFVLLLSFSELDVQKYKQVAGSMKNAFGVQNTIKVMDIPKGTSIIAKEFSPGRTQPSLIKTINQVTADTTKPSLQVGNPAAPKVDIEDLDGEQTKILLQEKLKSLIAETDTDAKLIKKILNKEIGEGKIDIESKDRTIVIRIREQGSFPSASATLHPDFIPVFGKLRYVLKGIAGAIAVEGHTDNVPITGVAFQSNWDLSSSRALSVTHELVKDNVLDSNRIMVIAHADTRPFQPNTSSQNRAKNRRVEIVIRQGIDDVMKNDIQAIQRSNPEVLGALTTSGKPDSNHLEG